MRISSIFVPFFTFMAGATGFYLRLLELMNAFEEYTGLPRRGAVSTYVLIAFSAVFLIIAFIFSLRATMKHKAPDGFENAFGTEPVTYPIAFSLVGALWFVATGKQYLDLNKAGPIPTTDLIFLIMSLLAAVSVAFFAIEVFQDPRHKSKFALSVIPSLFACYWLVIVYRQNASNPVLLSYCYQCLAIIASALGFYFTSGFVFNKPAPGKSIFFYSAAVYFCAVTLADNHPISIKLIFFSIIAINILHLSMLIKNLQWKEAAE